MQADSVAGQNKANEMLKQVKPIALGNNVLTTDAMVVPHFDEHKRGDDGDYDGDKSLSAMPPYQSTGN